MSDDNGWDTYQTFVQAERASQQAEDAHRKEVSAAHDAGLMGLSFLSSTSSTPHIDAVRAFERGASLRNMASPQSDSPTVSYLSSSGGPSSNTRRGRSLVRKILYTIIALHAIPLVFSLAGKIHNNLSDQPATGKITKDTVRARLTHYLLRRSRNGLVFLPSGTELQISGHMSDGSVVIHVPSIWNDEKCPLVLAPSELSPIEEAPPSPPSDKKRTKVPPSSSAKPLKSNMGKTSSLPLFPAAKPFAQRPNQYNGKTRVVPILHPNGVHLG